LGFPSGEVDPTALPSEFVERLGDAMRGAEESVPGEPSLEKMIQDVGDELAISLEETRGFSLRKERWPEGAAYSACLTHDVDSISRPFSHVFKRRERFTTQDLILAALGLRDPYDNMSYVADIEAARGHRSSFFFLSAGYDLRPRSKQLGSLASSGWEVGLHGDFGTHDSSDKMKLAVSEFRSATGINPVGVREHYLKFDFDATWEVMEKAGFLYDTTVGNTDRLGFRLGLCTPFHPPGDGWKPLKLLELPLVLMDTTLWGYLRRSETEGLYDFQELMTKVREVNGLFTILWHQEAARMKGGRIYPLLLDMLGREGCYVASGREVAAWWLKRSSPMVEEGGQFRMDDAPPGLVLKFKPKGGQSLSVEGGTVAGRTDVTTIKAKGGPLRLEVS